MTRTRPHALDKKRHVDRIAPRASGGREPDARGGDGVRGSRVMTAQARVTAGYYERADVQELVITAVLNELRRR
jgi:hypothetical protein